MDGVTICQVRGTSTVLVRLAASVSVVKCKCETKLQSVFCVGLVVERLLGSKRITRERTIYFGIF